MLASHHDIAFFTESGPVAVVEVKNSPDLTAEDATAVRRDLFSYSRLPCPEFFLVVSQDRGYVWRQKGRNDLDAPPDAEFSMHDMLANHYSSAVLSDRLRESELKTLIFHWLVELTAEPRGNNGRTNGVLEKLGFLDAIRGASATMDAST